MTAFNRPYFWDRMPWCEKAAWLTRTGVAKSYSDACSILGSLPRKRKGRVAPKDPALYRWDLRD